MNELLLKISSSKISASSVSNTMSGAALLFLLLSSPGALILCVTMLGLPDDLGDDLGDESCCKSWLRVCRERKQAAHH